jgi:hypothetical protein
MPESQDGQEKRRLMADAGVSNEEFVAWIINGHQYPVGFTTRSMASRLEYQKQHGLLAEGN